MREIPLTAIIKIPAKIKAYAIPVRKDGRETVDPVDLYSRNLESFHDRYFTVHKKCDGINKFTICLLEIKPNIWLFTKAVSWYGGRNREMYSEYEGRLVIRFHKRNHSGNINLQTQIDSMVVHTIYESPYGTFKFRGYDETRLTFQRLQNIVSRNLSDWQDALQSIFAIYLITDRNGGAYVGSATGQNGLWGRWSTYATGNFEGHADDVLLKERIGNDCTYPNNFEFTILEVFDMKKTRKEILNREKWWKDTLRTRVGHGNKGMNGN